MEIKIKKLHPSAVTPTYATDGSACFDLYAVGFNGTAFIDPKNSAQFDTHIAFEIPKDHVMLVFSRSGHGFKFDTRLSNCVGVIDSDFRGPVRVKLFNDGRTVMEVSPGDRIAQALVIPLPRITFTEVEELTPTERGEGGFGSTGK